MQPLLETLFPDGIIVVSTGGDPGPLFPEEEASLSNALSTRRREFAQGRTCAREALRILGIDPVPIPSRADRAPIWPMGVAGSITHCDGLAAAAITRTDRFTGIGLDAESRERSLDPRLDRFIRTPAERSDMDSLPPALDVVRLVFSAKESVHKSISPMSGITLSFQDVELDIDPDRGRFGVRIVGRRDERLPDFERLSGRFIVSRDFVLTAVVVAAE